MSDGESSHIGAALQQQSFLHRVREYLIEVEEEDSALDEESMVSEIDLAFARKQMKSLEDELAKYADHVKALELVEENFASVRERSQQKRLLLKDLESLLSGKFSLDSARFFTQSALDFASERAWGEMTLHQSLEKEESMILVFEGKSYAFLQLSSDEYVFHPSELSEEFCQLLKGFSE